MANVENGALQIAINNAVVGETVVLTSDITLTSKVTVSNVVTIDLNGYSIKGNINDGYGAIYVGTKGVLTIKDSSSGKTGGITNTLGHAIGNYGIVNIYEGTFTGDYALYNFYYSDTVYGTSTIYGGTFKSVNKDSPSIANCGDLTVGGGTIESIDTTSVLSVTGGIVESLYIGEADYEPPIQSTSVSGGYITELSVANDSVNEIAVSGGTFGTEINGEYFADGYKLAYDEGTGKYGVAVSSSGGGLKVIATSSSRIRQLPIRDKQLVFIQDLKRIAFDFNGKRVFYNQITELDSEADRLALEKPLKGYYFVIGSACLWSYQDEWIQITKRPDEVVFIGVELPELGSAKEGTLYVNKAEKEISVFDSDSNEYIVVADVTNEVTNEDIEKMFM